MSKYRTRWDWFVFLFCYGIILPILVVVRRRNEESIGEMLIVIPVVLGILTLFLFSIYMTTSYTIDGGYLRYRSFILFGKVKIDDIHRLVVGKTLHVGMKPAFARDGIIIQYKKYDEIYVSPVDNNRFVNELLSINPQIEVFYHKK